MAQPTQYYVDPAGGSDTTGDGTIGTPWASVQHALDNITRDSTNGDQINIKSGAADVLTGAIDLSTYGSPSAFSAPLVIAGYTSVANDGGLGDINVNNRTMFASTNYDAIQFRDLDLHNFGNNQAIHLDDHCTFDNCIIRDCTYTGTSQVIDIDAQSSFMNCAVYDMPNGSSSRIMRAGTGSLVVNNYFEQRGEYYAFTPSAYCTFEHNIVHVKYATGSNGIIDVNASNIKVRNNSIYCSVARTGMGLRCASSSNILVENNIFEGLSGSGAIGIDAPFTPENGIYRNNKAFNCTTAFNITNYSLSENNSTLSSSPFTDPSNNDFTVNDSVKAAGFPSYIGGRHFTSTPTYIDVGAAQRQETSGGGGSGAKFYIMSS